MLRLKQMFLLFFVIIYSDYFEKYVNVFLSIQWKPIGTDVVLDIINLQCMDKSIFEK